MLESEIAGQLANPDDIVQWATFGRGFRLRQQPNPLIRNLSDHKGLRLSLSG
jgi:hypothetical protein